MGLTEDDGKAACCVVVGKGGGVKIFTSLRGIWGVGLQVGLQKWGYIFSKVGLQNRVLERYDREGVKYCFFSDSP